LRSPDGLALEDAFVVSRPGFHQAPLMGFSKTAPPSTCTRDVHSSVRPSRLPVRVSRLGLPLPGAGPVPSSRFLTALTAFSVSRAAGLLHPAADPGVHRVRRLSRPRGRLWRPPRCVTLRRVSLSSSHPLSPGSCPLIVRHPRMARSRGLAPLEESVAAFSCFHAKEPDPPLGLSSCISRPSHPSAWASVPKDLGFASGACFARGARLPGIPPKRSLGLSRSSSRSHRPGIWTGSAGLSAGGVYGLMRARGGFEWRVPGERSLSVPRGAERSDLTPGPSSSVGFGETPSRAGVGGLWKDFPRGALGGGAARFRGGCCGRGASSKPTSPGVTGAETTVKEVSHSCDAPSRGRGSHHAGLGESRACASSKEGVLSRGEHVDTPGLVVAYSAG
jgi:hypothetical protein